MFTASREPAAYAEVVRLVIAALVAIGWIGLDDNATNAIVTAVGAVLSVVLTVVVRQHVTPVQPVPPASSVD